MARPQKYDWEQIKIAYEGGLNIKEISKKLKVTIKDIKDKARLKKWVIKSDINNDINEFIAKSEKLTENYEKHPQIAEMIEEAINTRLVDNKIIDNNRKLAQMAQGIIVRDKADIKYSNIRTLTGAIKDLESVANPQANRIEVNNQNNNQVIDGVRLIDA